MELGDFLADTSPICFPEQTFLEKTRKDGCAGDESTHRRHVYTVIGPAIGGYHPEAPLATSTDAVLLHQPLHPLLAHTDAALDQLPPDARPAVGTAVFRVYRADMRQQCLVAQMAAISDLAPPRPVLVETRDAHLEHPALHTDRPDPPWRSIKAYFTSGPLQSMPWLFPGCRAPSSPAPTRRATG